MPVKSKMTVVEFERATGHEFNPTKQFMDRLSTDADYDQNAPANQFVAVQWRGTAPNGDETFLLNWKHGGRQDVNVTTLKRNKDKTVEMSYNGNRKSFSVDALTIAFVPDGTSRAATLNLAVASLWKQFFPGEPLATGEAIEAIAAEFSATPASVVQTALAWYAGKTNQSTT